MPNLDDIEVSREFWAKIDVGELDAANNLVNGIDPDHSQRYMTMIEYAKNGDKESSRLLCEYLRLSLISDIPLHPLVRAYFANALKKIVFNNEEPNKALGFEKKGHGKKMTQINRARFWGIVRDVEKSYRETGKITKSFEIVGGKHHLSETRVREIYYELVPPGKRLSD